MRLSTFIPVMFAFGLAAILSVFSASYAVTQIEQRSVAAITVAMRDQGHVWITVASDGLQLELTGTAPDEATRFRAITVANGIVDAARVIDRLEVAAAAVIEAPRFSIEILRNDSGISLIGLIPAQSDRAGLLKRLEKLPDAGEVSDLLQTADFAVPPTWSAAIDFGLLALERLPRSKVSISADAVAVDAISDTRLAQRRLETELRRAAPKGVQVTLDIAAPRPVITPFTLRFLIDGDGARFDACSAATPEGRTRILSAARAAGLDSQVDCTIGLGVPSPDWPRAAATSIAALARLGGGSVTLSDVDITLIGTATTSQADFDRVVGELEGSLPEAFSLFAVLPEPVVIDGTGEGSGPPEFIVTKSPEGAVQLRGRIGDDRARAAMGSFARARFGIENVTDATRSDEDLPDGWLPRILAAMESLAQINHGQAVVQPTLVEISGASGNPESRAEVSRILSVQLGSAENFTLKITYDKRLDPVLGLPTPEECVDQINMMMQARKITFAPGSAEIDEDARETVERIAELLRTCDEVQMEIGGYTDSQGRETMNQQLSQSRAEAVLSALAARRVATANLNAIGYGEERPIATNETEDGREANRRIEFKLILPEDERDSGDEPIAGDNATEQPGEAADERESAADGVGDEAFDDGSGDEGSGDGDADNGGADDAEMITGGAGSNNEQN